MYIPLISRMPRLAPIVAFYGSRFTIAALMTAVLVQAAMIFDLFVPGATYYAFLAQILIVLFYLVSPFQRYSFVVMGIGYLILAYLLFEHVMFVRLTGMGTNFNAIASYFPLLAFVPFFRNRASVSFMLRYLAALTFVYCLIYVVGNHAILSQDFSHQRGVSSGDVGRAARVYLALAFAAYLVFYAVTDRGGGLIARSAMFVVGVAALVLSGSRTFQLLFMLVLGLWALRLFTRTTRIALFCVVMTISAFVVAGALFPAWNPFLFISWDSSGYARAMEYSYAAGAVRSHWLFGVGIAGSFGDLQSFLRTPMYEPLYATDLGAMGPLVIFGLPGLAAFILVTYFCMVTPTRQLGDRGITALRLTCAVCGAFGVISPSVLMETNAMFPALLFAAWARAGGVSLPAFIGIRVRRLGDILRQAFVPKRARPQRFRSR